MSPVELELQGPTAILRLNQPARLNALSEEMGEAFQSLVRSISSDPKVRVAVLTGLGRAFSAGGDLDFLEARAQDTAQANAERMRAFYARFLSIRDLPVPVIAAVNGPAIGAGLCLAVACDLRVVADDAKLGATFVKLGLHPGMAATHLFPALLGPGRAAELLLTGRVVRGSEAVSLGLANESRPAAEVLPRALEIAEEMAAASPQAVRATVRTLRNRQDDLLERALWREADAQAHNYASDDLREGIASIREKRTPSFRDA
jgi:enoyl-CoA hydratase/carnithine racemase